MEVKCCGDGWGWKTCLDGMDTVCAVTDGDGLMFHYPLPCRSLICKLNSSIILVYRNFRNDGLSALKFTEIIQKKTEKLHL